VRDKGIRRNFFSTIHRCLWTKVHEIFCLCKAPYFSVSLSWKSDKGYSRLCPSSPSSIPTSSLQKFVPKL